MEKLRLGMPTMIETESIRHCAQVCRELGLDFVELNLNFPQFLLHKLDAEQLNGIAAEYAVGYTIHLDDEMSVADFNPYVAHSYTRTVTEAVYLAKKIGVKKLNMHLSRGAKYTLPDRVIYFFDAYRADYLDNIRYFRDVCAEAIGDSGIQILVENTAGFLPFQQEAVNALLESPAFGLTYDVGHNHCIKGHDEPIILARKEHLHHMHLHDVKDGTKDHQALGTGELDIFKYLNLAKERDISVVVETKTIAGLKQSAAWLHENWK
jgi:sugar phosphate isomerase/epimerase